jgi:nucleoside-diphosphate-sugar epimerase
MEKTRVAILGATSHIAKNLILSMAAEYRLSLFARSTEKVEMFLKTEGIAERIEKIRAIDVFGDEDAAYAAIINCVGLGTPDKIRTQGVDVFFITERYDNSVLDYLNRHSETVYVNFSSGAVYDPSGFDRADNGMEFRLRLDSITSADAYRVSKINSETKHRSMPKLDIIDLRLFSFFSRFIDLGSSYLVTELVRAVRDNKEFLTDRTEIIRDYVHPADLVDLVLRCIGSRCINRPFDVYSGMPAKKSELIRLFIDRFDLRVKYSDKPTGVSPTGIKTAYMSHNKDAEAILGYVPRFSSIDSILSEAEALLRGGAGRMALKR